MEPRRHPGQAAKRRRSGIHHRVQRFTMDPGASPGWRGGSERHQHAL